MFTFATNPWVIMYHLYLAATIPLLIWVFVVLIGSYYGWLRYIATFIWYAISPEHRDNAQWIYIVFSKVGLLQNRDDNGPVGTEFVWLIMVNVCATLLVWVLAWGYNFIYNWVFN